MNQGTAGKRPFVLVHGAYHGGWCWSPVAERLRAAGHAVHTPTLIGLGNRAHLGHPGIGLEDHILDVVGLVRRLGLNDLVLVGHSYAGMVIEGACDRLRDAVAHAVFLDGAIPADGESAFPALDAATLEQRFGPYVDGYLVPVPRDVARLGIPAANVELTELVRRQLTPHPMRAWTDRLRLRHGGSSGLTRSYVYCTVKGPDQKPNARVAIVRDDPAWGYHELACGHDAMLAAPDLTTALLLRLVAQDAPEKGL
ncbi:MAG: alpha/beta hydrolase [Azospirillaceae bacterium]|nr:alpha/beta hydrolase [Azospirillaceae bacterium]